MGKMVMVLDAKADGAIREIDKVKKRLEKTARAPKGINTELVKMAAQFVSVGAAIAAAGRGFKDWLKDIDEASKKATDLARQVSQVAGGAGFTSESPQMRNFIAQRRGYQPISQDISQLAAYTSVNTASTAAQRRAMLPVMEMANMMGLGESFPRILGGLNATGVEGTQAVNMAAYMAQAFGGQAENYSKTVGRLASSGAPMEQMMPFLASAAMGQYSPESMQALYARFQQSGQTDFAQWMQTVDPTSLGGENAVRLMGIRRNLGRVPQYTGTGYFESQAQAFAGSSQGQRIITIGQAERETESFKMARDQMTDVARAVARRNLNAPGNAGRRSLNAITFGGLEAAMTYAPTVGQIEEEMTSQGRGFGLDVTNTMAQLEQAMRRNADAIERQNVGPITMQTDAMGRN